MFGGARAPLLQGQHLCALRHLYIAREGAEVLTLYQWGTRTAEHHFCSICGIYTDHRRRSNPDEYGVNAACIDGVDIRALEPIQWLDGVHHPSDDQD